MCRQRGVVYGGEVYWPPLHLQPAYKAFVSRNTPFDVIEEYGKRMVNPPMFSQMTEEQAERVLAVTRHTLSELKGG